MTLTSRCFKTLQFNCRIRSSPQNIVDLILAYDSNKNLRAITYKQFISLPPANLTIPLSKVKVSLTACHFFPLKFLDCQWIRLIFDYSNRSFERPLFRNLRNQAGYNNLQFFSTSIYQPLIVALSRFPVT